MLVFVGRRKLSQSACVKWLTKNVPTGQSVISYVALVRQGVSPLNGDTSDQYRQLLNFYIMLLL